MACYDNIIGLSQIDCPCIQEGPEDFNASDSGLFIDNYDFVKMLSGFDSCDTGSAWDVLTRARANAVKMFLNDVKGGLLARFGQRVASFSGAIGNAAGRNLVTSAAQYVGVRIMPNPIRGGSIRITKIGVMFPVGTATGTVTVYVYNSLNVLMATRVINKGSGHVSTVLTEPVNLPTFTDYSEKHDYYLVYQHNQSAPAIQNTVSCGCGGVRHTFNRAAPTWLSGRQNRATAWGSWAMVAGWAGNTLTDFDQDDSFTSEQSNGLTMVLECGCDVSGVLCAGSIDYNTDPSAMSQAYAVYYASVGNVIDAIFRSDKLVRAGMINRDQLKTDKAEARTRYEEAVKYVIDNATLNNNDCLACKETSGLKVKMIKA